MQRLPTLIEQYFQDRSALNAHNFPRDLQQALDEILDGLDNGSLRIAEKMNEEWVVHQWLKKAILLYFQTHDNQMISGSVTNYFDKIPLKFSYQSEEHFKQNSVRVIPPACARKGAYIAPSVVLMPSYVNLGAYIDRGTMVDTWATVGSCAQIGKNVHLSGGVGIGGVLEPLQANPVIIEDNCFIGARSEVVEGVIVEEGSVISMGVFLGQSTKIYHRETGQITYGRIPKRSVVVPGNLPAKDGSHSLYCAVIVKQVDEKTREKTSINELLRD